MPRTVRVALRFLSARGVIAPSVLPLVDIRSEHLRGFIA